MTAPKAQRATNNTYCLKKCLGEKSLSSNVHILFKRKFDVIERIIPNSVANMYQMFGTKFDIKKEAT